MAGLAHRLAESIDGTPLSHEPFDHLQLQEFFPEDVFAGMVEHLPDPRFFIDMTNSGGQQYNGKAARSRVILQPGIIAGLPRAQRAFWLDVAAALASPSVETSLKRKFADVLSARFDCPPTEVRVYPFLMLVRDLAGYEISVHHDSWSKVINAQFYLPADDERAYLGTQFFERDESKNDTLIKTIPFVRNSGYAFPVSDKSWHGVTRLSRDELPRHSLMLIYYVTPHLAKRVFLAWKDFNQVVRARSVAMVRGFQKTE
ncbi:MAG: hypothetical protein R3229_01660 [Alphaproteobacteria bacterium]|nr:hypothetical protein [Alphaproteobacteria bacterium]